MKVKSEHEVAQLCLTLCDPMDFSPPGSSIHGSFQARVLEWVAIAFSSLGWELIRNVHSQNSPQISESQSLCCVGGARQLLGVEPGSWFSLDLQNAHLNLEPLGHFFICQFRTTGYYNWLAFLFNLFFSQSNSSRTFFPRVQFSHSVVSDCWRPHGLQHMRLPCPSPTPRVYSVISIEWFMPSSHLILLSSPSPPGFSLSQDQGLFRWLGSSHLVAKVLEFQLQHQCFKWIFRTNFL